ncbi:hypothetical protein F5878DRAFT_620270 [Lentinula raphanica]|uniref:Nnf1-domain-containing protein n=1 Tax=Lentinula raphanica TaxID=153919 RepID=A0AA38P8P1_9AGAR|nr:hypothetical protein EV360DRAFT_49502 [Lentinula raphanica]KAJ3838165.1 hypothetical protein F5878DRAFT_620270 [Lentinula raphanica]
MFNQSGSRRWEHFQSALQLAVQRTARKWSYEDFTQCFPLYAEEDKNGASTTFNMISDYIETQALRDMEKIFETYKLRENIDTLHALVTEAKERKKAGAPPGKDTWRENLDARSAMAARTVPVLEQEAKRLRETLASLKDSNTQLETEIKANVEAADDADERCLMLFQELHKALEEWQEVSPDIEAWTVTNAESSEPPVHG